MDWETRLIDSLKRGERGETAELLKEKPEHEWPSNLMLPFVLRDTFIEGIDEDRLPLACSAAEWLYGLEWEDSTIRKKLCRLHQNLTILRLGSLFTEDGSDETIVCVLDSLRTLSRGNRLSLFSQLAHSSLHCPQRRQRFTMNTLSPLAHSSRRFLAVNASSITEEAIRILFPD